MWEGFVSERRVSSLSYVRLCDVTPHHAMAVEIIGVLSYRILHHPYPCMPGAVKHRYDNLLEFVVKIVGIASIQIIDECRFRRVRTYGPSCITLNMAFYPPTVKNAEIHAPIVRRLHAAR